MKSDDALSVYMYSHKYGPIAVVPVDKPIIASRIFRTISSIQLFDRSACMSPIDTAYDRETVSRRLRIANRDQVTIPDIPTEEDERER